MNAHQKKITVVDSDMPSDAEIDASMWNRLSRHSNKAMMLLYAAQKLAPGSPDDMTLPAVLEAAELQLNNVLTWTRSRADHYRDLSRIKADHERHEAEMANHPHYIPPRPRVSSPLPDDQQAILDLYGQTLQGMRAVVPSGVPADLYNAAGLSLVIWRDLLESAVAQKNCDIGGALVHIEHAEHELGMFIGALRRAKEALAAELAPPPSAPKGRRKMPVLINTAGLTAGEF
jgi:hypothetical protein